MKRTPVIRKPLGTPKAEPVTHAIAAPIKMTPVVPRVLQKVCTKTLPRYRLTHKVKFNG